MKPTHLFDHMRSNRQKRADVARRAAELEYRLCEANYKAAFAGINPPAKRVSNYAECVEIATEVIARRAAREEAERIESGQTAALTMASIAAYEATHFAKTGQLPVLDFADFRTGATVWKA